jgi:hypothetical protein
MQFHDLPSRPQCRFTCARSPNHRHRNTCCPIVCLTLPGHPWHRGIAGQSSQMMARFVRQHQGQSVFRDRPVPYQTTINPNVPSRSKSPGLGIDRWRFPKQIVGNFRKSAPEFAEQIEDELSTSLLHAPARRHRLHWPIQEAHMVNICALPQQKPLNANASVADWLVGETVQPARIYHAAAQYRRPPA